VGPSRLVNRNVTALRGRTSMRLEPELWAALEEICRREKLTLGEVVKRVEQRVSPGGRTGAVRVYVLGYFREAVTEEGHRAAGHGPLEAHLPAAEEPAWAVDQRSREVAAVG
jgi:predicted DNA-binding ribbon-helix-helix protein